MLTELEARILNFIGEYLRENAGQSPTLSEIGEGCGVRSVGTIHRYLSSIEDKGYLEKARKGWRTRLAPNELPFLGQVAAGKPLEAIEQAESINLAALLMQPDCIVLRVDGDSMIDRGILDGDLVVIKPTQSARNGQIVVALVDDEATLKEFQRIDGGRRVKLIPHNTSLEPQIYEVDAVQIQGTLLTVIRTDP